MRKKRIVRFFLLAELSMCSLHSATSSNTINVKCNVIAQCSVSAATLDFGDYDPTSTTPLDRTAELIVSCSKNQPYTLSANLGNGTDATLEHRVMTLNTNQAVYQVFRDKNLTEVFGDPTAKANTYSITGIGNGLLTPNKHTLYGRMPINQDIPPGVYSDTITVTVTY